MNSHKQDAHLDQRLDEALKESFPASDPPAVHRSDDPPRTAPPAHSGQGLRREKRRTASRGRKPRRVTKKGPS